MGSEVVAGNDWCGAVSVGDVRVEVGGGCAGNVAGMTVLEGVVADEAPGEIGEIEEIGEGA